MAQAKQAYNSILSAFSSFNERRKATSKETEPVKDRAQLAAEKLIQKSPMSAKGYLASGELYKEHNNLLAALDIYRKGLRIVPTSDAQYDDLQKEKEIVSATIYERNRGFHQLLPYDVLSLIFGFLDFRDLLRCTGVCQAWCNFMVDWPEFWQQLAVEMPQMQRSTLDPLIRRQAQEFRLEGPMNTDLVHDFLMFLAYSDNHFIQKLSFNGLSFKDPEAVLLAAALRSTSPPVKLVEFHNCELPMHRYIDPVLSACSSMEHVTFSQINPLQRSMYITPPSRSQIVLPKTEFSSLTYLKLCFQSNGDYNYSIMQQQTGYLVGIIRRSPNLIHLFLESGVIHAGTCVLDALKYCHRIQNLVVNRGADMPDDTLMSAIDDSEFELTPSDSPSSSSSSQSPSSTGLRRLVLSGGHMKIEKKSIGPIFKKVHKTLELLYIHYDASVITPSSFYRLAYYGAPQLREIRMSTENSCGNSYKQPPISKALAALFSWCPVLEVVELYNTFTSSHTYIQVDDEVLKAIAENCPLIRHIKISGRPYHSQEGMRYFISTGGSKLTYLDIDIDRSLLLEVVTKLQALQRLHARSESYSYRSTIPQEERTTVERILRERGGALVIH